MYEIHNPALDETSRRDKPLIEEAYLRERALRDLVARGDREGAKRLIETYPLADKMLKRLPLNTLRAAKNAFVVLNTILRLSAEQGGLPPMILHGISSDFAGRIERMKDLEETSALRNRMIDTYCEAVRKYSMNNHSRAVRAATEYILTHLDEKIGLAKLAGEMQYTPSYLSRQFRREYSQTVGAYIREKKMEEARFLLSETDESLSLIADKLGYDNVSYFIGVFRRSTGTTPGKYRDLHKDALS